MVMISPELLRMFPVFGAVDDDGLKQVAMLSEERKFARGSVIFEQERPADALYLILDGEVAIVAVFPDGERYIVDTEVAGDLLCISAVVAPHETRFRAVARTDVRVVAIQAAPLRERMRENQNLGYQLMTRAAEALVQRLEGSRLQLAVDRAVA